MSACTPSRKGKRKVKLTACPNPLFEQWLTEWKLTAAERGQKTQYVYNKALQTLKKYPTRLDSGAECRILENFGEKTCKMLDEKLAEYVAQYGTTEPVDGYLTNNNNNRRSKKAKTGVDGYENLQFDRLNVPPPPSTEDAATTTTPKRQRRRSEKEYIPQYRSGAYAILLTLVRNPNPAGHMSKKDLMQEAQPLADKSFTIPEPGSRYTAWSSMGTLINKGLVVKESNPAKYRITPAGQVLAARIFDAERNGSIGRKGSFDDNNDNHLTEPALPRLEIGAAATSTVTINDVDSSSSEPEILETRPKPKVEATAKKFVFKHKETKTSSSTTQKTVTKHSEVPIGIFPSATSTSSFDLTKKTTQSRLVPQGPVLGLSSSSTSQSQESSTSSQTSTDEPPIILRPGFYDIELCVDNSEVYGNDKSKQMMVKELAKLKVPHNVRPMNVGDFCWVARDKFDRERELVLDYIIERKRMDDLASSIIDGRFKEQKFRLKNCGIQHPIYLVEDYGSMQHFSIGEDALHQAITNTQITDGFYVKRTSGVKESAAYLTLMTRYLQSLYSHKTLCTVEKTSDSDVLLMPYQRFNKSSVKSKTLTVREMFGKQLCQLRGMTAEKAVAILAKYPTIYRLTCAYMGCATAAEKEKLLANIKFGPLQKNIGAALSKSVYFSYNTKGSDL